jgi:hypothetical protein
LPVLLENCDAPLRLRRFQYVDFTKVEFREGIKRAKQLLETLLTEQSAPVITINPELEPQKASNRKVTPAPPLPNKNKPVQRQWVGVGAGILTFAICLGVLGAIIVFRDFIFPSAPTRIPAAIETIIQTATELPTDTPSLVPPSPVPPSPVPPTPVPPTISPSIPWTIDTAGVCRDDRGDYPRWSEYNWTLSQCEDACQNNPNCQGFAMSNNKNYCQLFGSDGQNGGSEPGAQISRGDQAQPAYACYLKSGNESILAWTMDSRGVCRDDAGGYPRWSEYNWTLSQCEDACRNNPNCQGFAMSKEKNYCQLFGSDGQYGGTDSGTYITHGDSSQPAYTCFIKR